MCIGPLVELVQSPIREEIIDQLRHAKHLTAKWVYIALAAPPRQFSRSFTTRAHEAQAARCDPRAAGPSSTIGTPEPKCQERPPAPGSLMMNINPLSKTFKLSQSHILFSRPFTPINKLS